MLAPAGRMDDWRNHGQSHTAHNPPMADRPSVYRPADARCRPQGATAFVRVLPTEDRGERAATLGLYPTSGAARTTLRLSHIRSGRLHQGTDPRDGLSTGTGDSAGSGGPFDLRRRYAGGGQ